MNDTYKTISKSSETIFKEKMSRFIAFAYPVKNLDEIKLHLQQLQKEYYDARHICYAYMLGDERDEFRANDNGEPSGTAGKPILGQINSFDLTNILIVVVRYFGGIKLGTGGLTVAYREAARQVILENEIIEKTIDRKITFKFEYQHLNDVMRIIKEENCEMIFQNFEMECEISISIRQSLEEKVKNRLSKIETLTITDKTNNSN